MKSCLTEESKCFWNVIIPKSYPTDSQEESNQTNIISVYITAEVGNGNIDLITAAVRTPTQTFCVEGDLMHADDS